MQMGELLGCKDRYYQKIEYGKVKFNQDNLIKLADFFDVSLDYLVGGQIILKGFKNCSLHLRNRLQTR